MPINRPRRFIRRVYKEIQRGESVRPSETRHCDSREARVKKAFKAFYRKKHFSNEHQNRIFASKKFVLRIPQNSEIKRQCAYSPCN